ncbi:MAG TPA: LPS assembly lipoprotein LptE [Elusimicrobiales bacterium]|nr:LPS assembly lipoprotein LptE [Elusimicrobiales bacterium]
MKNMFKLSLIAGFLLVCGCANKQNVVYNPHAQKVPQHIRQLAVSQFVNKTNFFGLEEKLTLKVIDEFLKDATYPIVSEERAKGIIEGQINRYILTPIQYDTALVPSVYKLTVLIEVRLFDKQSQEYLWIEPALEGVQIYSASTLAGGMTEEQAREFIWETLANDVVKRTIEGFGSISSQSQKKIAPTDPGKEEDVFPSDKNI